MTTYANKLRDWTYEHIFTSLKFHNLKSLYVGNLLQCQVTFFSLFTFMHWRRKWQPTPVFLLGETQGQWSLVGCRLWGHTESDTTKANQQLAVGRQMEEMYMIFCSLIVSPQNQQRTKAQRLNPVEQIQLLPDLRSLRTGTIPTHHVSSVSNTVPGSKSRHKECLLS